MRQFARGTSGRRHGPDEGYRDTILEQDGGLVSIERPIDDVSEPASGIGDG